MRFFNAALFFISALCSVDRALAFDCAKATSDTEKTICAAPALKAADDAMSVAYQAVFARLNGAAQDQLKLSQLNFIADRELCGSGDGATTCAMNQTISRIVFLNGGIEPGALTGPMPLMEQHLVQQLGDAKKGLYTINYATIRFSDPASAGEKAFNATMETLISDALLGPQSDMIEFATEYPWEQSISTRITLLNENFISAEIQTYTYEGGAHGNGGVYSASFNRETGEAINIAKMLGADAVAGLVPVCRDQIFNQKVERQAGFDPDTAYDISKDEFYSDEIVESTLNDATTWRLEPKGATVTFNAYALGAYAEGVYECVFSAELLKVMTGGKLVLQP